MNYNLSHGESIRSEKGDDDTPVFPDRYQNIENQALEFLSVAEEDKE